MIGPSGSGKTMLARRLSTILPDMTLDEFYETTKIHSISNSGDRILIFWAGNRQNRCYVPGFFFAISFTSAPANGIVHSPPF